MVDMITSNVKSYMWIPEYDLDEEPTEGLKSRAAMNGWRLVTLVLILGIALGALTRLADNQENALTWLGSLTAPWILAAFVIGALAPRIRHGIVAGASALTLAVVTYYAWMRLFEGGVNLDYFLSITTFWLLLAPPAGAMFGLAGSLWRGNRSRWGLAALAVGVPAGLIAGESAFMAVTASSPSIGEILILAGFAVTGLALPGTLLRERRNRAVAYAVAGGMLLIGLATVSIIRMLVALLE